MTSYLCIRQLSKSVAQEDRADLPYLVGLRPTSIALEVDPLLHIDTPKDVVATLRPLLESQVKKKAPESVEADGGV
jgi:hypothetical protein